MSRDRLIMLLALLFLVASILFFFYQKKGYTKRFEEIKQEKIQVEKTAALKRLWSTKGMQKKLHNLFKRVPKAKVERLKIERTKVNIKLNSLSDKEINYLLTKLAILPVEFKKLNIVKSGNSFILEALCAW